MGKKKKETQTINVAEEQRRLPPFDFKRYLPHVVILLFAILLYSNTFHHEYAVDDAIVITENDFTKQGLEGLEEIFTTDAFQGFFGERGSKLVAGGRYRPLSMATFALEYEIWELDHPGISHFINALLYGFCGILIFLLLQTLIKTGKKEVVWFTIPFLTAMFFVLHPIHTEAVANIKGRDEIMGFLFAIAALFFSIKYIKTKNNTHLIMCALAFALGLLSKENVITFLAIFPLTFYFFTDALKKDYIRIAFISVVLVAIYLYFRSQFTDSAITDASSEILNNPFVNATSIQKFATIILSMLLYVKLLVLPHPLTHDYYFNHIPLTDFSDWRVWISILIFAGLIYYALSNFKKRSILSFCILYYLITISIVSNVLFTVGVIMNERFVFMPSLAFSLAVAYGISLLYSKEKTKIAALVLLGMITLGYTVKTYSRNFAWKNNYTLFTNDVKFSPNSAKLRTSAGGDSIAESDKYDDKATKDSLLDQAIVHLNEAIKIYPNHSNAWLLLGNAVYKKTNDANRSIEIYEQAKKLRRNYYDAIYNAGCVHSDAGNYLQALKEFRRAFSFKPNNTEVVYNLAATYEQVGKLDSALGFYNRSIQLTPDRAINYYKAGVLLGKKMGNIKDAIPYLKKAVELNPGNISFLEDLGVAQGFQGDVLGAIDIFNRILKIDPNYASAYYNLYISYRNMGKMEEAAKNFQKAAELNPKYAGN